MLKKIVTALEALAVVAALVAVVLLFVAQPGGDTAGAGSSGGSGTYLAETGGLPANGAEIYAVKCAGCHGSAGQGGAGPRLAGRVADAFPDAEDQIVLVTRGRGGMPAFGSLGDADVRLVVEYTRSGLGG